MTCRLLPVSNTGSVQLHVGQSVRSGGLWQVDPYSTPLTWFRPVGHPVVGLEADFIHKPQMLQPHSWVDWHWLSGIGRTHDFNSLIMLTKKKHVAYKTCAYRWYPATKVPTRHAYAWQIGPFWQETLDILRDSNTQYYFSVHMKQP